MSNIEDFFVAEGRVSRRALARFAKLASAEVDRIADDLAFGPLLSFAEAEEVLTVVEEDDSSEVEDDAGVEKYQCCIHPWMRTEVRIAAR